MLHIPKKILLDEDNKPVAVQIEYTDWLEIEREIGGPETGLKIVDLSPFVGILNLTEDPVEFQRRIRDEWP